MTNLVKVLCLNGALFTVVHPNRHFRPIKSMLHLANTRFRGYKA